MLSTLKHFGSCLAFQALWPCHTHQQATQRKGLGHLPLIGKREDTETRKKEEKQLCPAEPLWFQMSAPGDPECLSQNTDKEWVPCCWTMLPGKATH